MLTLESVQRPDEVAEETLREFIRAARTKSGVVTQERM